MPRGSISTLRMVIPSTPDQIQVVEEKAEKLAKKVGFSEDERDSIAIAVTEMIANAIFHGNKGDMNKSVTVEFKVNQSLFQIVIQDQGMGFDPEKIDNPLEPQNLLKDSGRGIFIVKTLMDQITFDFSSTGTKVTMKKFKKR